jgi:hypothetical protein
MSRRAWLNVVLGLVVVVLTALVVLQPGLERPAEAPPLADRAPASVNRIRVERPDQQAAVLEKRDGRWYLVEPLALAANGFRVQTLLEILDVKSEHPLDAKGLELARFGLDPPRATLWLDDLRFDFGDTESLSGKRYVRLGDSLHLTTDRFYQQVVAGVPGFVDLNPLGPDAEPVALELPDLKLRRDAGRWLVEPDDGGYSADAINRLVDAWRTTQAITVRSLEPAEGGRSVSVTLRGAAAPLRFLAIETPHALILARPDVGLQYHLPTEAAARLFRLSQSVSPPEEAGDAPGPVGTQAASPAEADAGQESPDGEGPDPGEALDILGPPGERAPE